MDILNQFLRFGYGAVGSIVACGFLVGELLAQIPGTGTQSAETPGLEQRGGGGRGGGDGMTRGNVDTRGGIQRRGPFSSLPWDAQNLFEKYGQTFSQLPRSLQAYTVGKAGGWDDFFPPEKDRFVTFFETAESMSQEELQEAFQGLLPNVRPQGQRGGRGQGRRGGVGRGARPPDR